MICAANDPLTSVFVDQRRCVSASTCQSKIQGLNRLCCSFGKKSTSGESRTWWSENQRSVVSCRVTNAGLPSDSRAALCAFRKHVAPRHQFNPTAVCLLRLGAPPRVKTKRWVFFVSKLIFLCNCSVTEVVFRGTLELIWVSKLIF